MKYSHIIEELKNDELKLVSDEAGTIDSVIITKEMIPWIINVLQSFIMPSNIYPRRPTYSLNLFALS